MQFSWVLLSFTVGAISVTKRTYKGWTLLSSMALPSVFFTNTSWLCNISEPTTTQYVSHIQVKACHVTIVSWLVVYHQSACWYYTQTHSMHRKVFASICLLAHSWVLLMSSFSSNTRLDSGPIPPPPKQVLISLSLITWTSITFFRGSLSLHRLLTYHPESLAVKFLNPWVHALLKGTREEISSEMVGFPMHLENIHPNIRLVALYEVIFFSICVWMICFRQWWDCIR